MFSAQLGCHVTNYHSITIQKGKLNFGGQLTSPTQTRASVTLF